METTIVYWVILGSFWDNGKEKGLSFRAGFEGLGFWV